MDQPSSGERASRWLLPVLAVVAVAAAMAALWAARGARLMGSTPAAAPFEMTELGGDDSALDFKGYAINPSRPAPTFELKSSAGMPWHLADARGKVVVLFFGYTHCPDVCPQTLNLLAQTTRELGAAAADIETAFISVDPDRDTPDVLNKYLAGFDPRFVGLTGTVDELQQTASAYGVMFKRDAPAAAVALADTVATDHATDNSSGPAIGGRDDSDVSGTGDAADAAADKAAPAEHSGSAGVTGGEQIAATSGGSAMSGATGTGHDQGLSEEVGVKFDEGSGAYTLTHSGTVLLIDRHGRLRSALLLPFTPADAAHDLRLLLGEAPAE